MKKNSLWKLSLASLAIFSSITCATVALAAGNQFTIGVNVVSDSIPPSTPVGLSATAISSSQINLSWTASTDNIAVGGYVIRRGSTPIATTSAITFSDTGLAASTAFDYTVQAFDTTLNYSGISATSTATTSAPAGGGGGGGPVAPTATAFSPVNGAVNVSPTTTISITMSQLVNVVSGNITVKRFSDNVVVDTISVGGGQVSMNGAIVNISLTQALAQNTQYYIEVAAGTFSTASGGNFAGISGNVTWSFTTANLTPPVISGVSVSTTYTTAVITFTTDKPALTTLDWGTSTTYALGSASEVIFATSHSITLNRLATNTIYFFRLNAKDTLNNFSITYTGNFSTQNPPPPPDTTPPANPTGFSATAGLTNIQLTWNNPTDIDFSAVRIMRRTGGYPIDPADGVLIYDGTAEAFNNTGLAVGTRYYYTAFARDTLFNYSSGALATAITNTGVIVPPPPPSPTPTPVGTPPPPPSPLGGGSPSSTTPPAPTPVVIFPPITSTSSGPFVDFIGTGTPSAVIAKLSLNDVLFIQLGETEEPIIIHSGTLRVNGDFPVKVIIDAKHIPESLTSIAISIEDPKGKKAAVSYLLRINKNQTAYEGIVPRFDAQGNYTFTISILDHERQAITRLAGIFNVFLIPKISPLIPDNVAKVVTQAMIAVSGPVSDVSSITAPIGVAAGASQAILLATNVGSGYDLYLLLLKFIGLLTGLFRRKRKEPWGVVYDSVTKRPLDPAYVIAQLRESAQSKGEAITDLDGRYGFFLNPGEYTIVANKTHYKFPSEKLKGKARDEFYENLYFGDSFQVRDGGVVQYNIPLDPVEFDWNEYAKNQDKVFQIYSKKKNIRLWVFNTIFFVGLIFSLLSLILSYSVLNLAVVLVYAFIFVFQVFWTVAHKVTYVINSTTGKRIPFALVKVWLPGLNTVVKKTVSDETGRFYFLVPPGTYYVTVEEKQLDGSYKEVMRTKDTELKGGVVKSDLVF